MSNERPENGASNNESTHSTVVFDFGFFPPLPAMIRQLSVAYPDPNTGLLTNDDPQGYEGNERERYEDSLIAAAPDSGYAQGIIASRNAALLPRPQQ
ncbi:MAG TPA: hypothetical protein DDY37_07290 [Legionella sp.]|nr:hypothetical protein [Legionella sp.]